MKRKLLVGFCFFVFMSMGNVASMMSMNPDGARLGPAVLKAVLDSDMVELKRLFMAGADVLYSDINGVTPLMVAAGIGNVEVVRIVLDAYSSDRERYFAVKCYDKSYNTPLVYAVKSGNREVVQLIHKQFFGRCGRFVSQRYLDLFTFEIDNKK